MSDERVPAGPEIRAQLGAAFRRFDVVDTPEGKRVSGSVFAGDALVGPPGRVHGGLHAVLRLIAPFEKLVGGSPRPLTVRLDLLRSMPLGEELPFEGRLSEQDGRPRLETRFRDTDRLLGDATLLAPDAPRPELSALREAYKRDLETPPIATIRVRGSVDTRIGERLVVVEVNERFDAVPDHDLARYRAPGGQLDTVFAAVGLDLLGATVGGFEWRNHLYTSRLTIDLFETPERAEGCLLIGDRTAMTPRADSVLPGLELGGVLRKETDIPVYLVDAAVERVYASGVVTVYPSTLVVKPPPGAPS